MTDHVDWPRYDCTILTYEDASVCNFWHTWTCLGGKFPLFCSLRTHYETCLLLKRCVCTHLLTHESMIMCSFEHNFPLVHPMWRVSTKLYQLWDVTICNFSLKDAFLHYFDLRGRLQVQIFTEENVYVCNFSHTKSCQRSLVWPTRRTVMCIHCEKRPSVQLCDLHGRVRMQIFSWEDVSDTTCRIISYVWARPTCFVETRHIGWTNGKLCSKLHIIMDSCVRRCVQTHLF